MCGKKKLNTNINMTLTFDNMGTLFAARLLDGDRKFRSGLK